MRQQEEVMESCQLYYSSWDTGKLCYFCSGSRLCVSQHWKAINAGALDTALHGRRYAKRGEVR